MSKPPLRGNPLESSIEDSPLLPDQTHLTPAEPKQSEEATADATAHRLPEIAGFEILSVLGRGGMGVVYRARQMSLGRVVALKMILSGVHAGAQEMARFKKEAEAVARLRHENILQVFDKGTANGCPYLVMEFVEGAALDKRIAGQPQEHKYAASLVEQLARAMHFAHTHGILHRDLKPANVLMTADGAPKVADFGLAKFLTESRPLTGSGNILGTPRYMAPEQAGAVTRRLTPAVDIYALGVILYEMLTGRTPFQGEPSEVIFRVLTEEPVPPSKLQAGVPRDLETICLKCLEKEPKKRYTTAEELAEDLRRFLANEPILAKPVRWWGRTWRWAKRRPMVAALVALLAAVIVASIIGLTALWLRAAANLEKANSNFQLALRTTDAIRKRARDLNELSGATTVVLETLLRMTEENLALLRKAGDSLDVQKIRAETLTLAANLSRERGRTDLALPQAEEAVAIYERLVKSQPQNRQWQAGLYQALFACGLVHVERGQSPKALADFQNARCVADRLTKAEPGNADYADLWARSLWGVAIVCEQQGYMEKADEALNQAFAIRQRLAKEAKEQVESLRKSRKQKELAIAEQALLRRRAGLALAYGWRGKQRARESPAGALDAYRRKLQLHRDLLTELPASILQRKDLAETCINLATAVYATGDEMEAESLLQEALQISSALVLVDPENGELARLNIFARLQQSQLLFSGAKKAERINNQLQALQSFRPVCDDYCKKDPKNVSWQDRLALTDLLIANNTAALIRLGELSSEKLKPVLTAARAALSTRRRLMEADPESWQRMKGAAQAYRIMAGVESLVGTHRNKLTLEAAKVQIAFFKRRRQREPKKTHWVKELARAFAEGANCHAKAERYVASGKEYRKAIALAESIAMDPAWQRELARWYREFGDIFLFAEEFDAYYENHVKALALRRRIADAKPRDAALRCELAQSYDSTAFALKKLGHAEKAIALLTQARNERLRLALRRTQSLGKPRPGKTVGGEALATYFHEKSRRRRANTITLAAQLFENNPNSDSAVTLVESCLDDAAAVDFAEEKDKSHARKRLQQILDVYQSLRQRAGALLPSEQALVTGVQKTVSALQE